jgi:Fusaric acid resistance protein-like
MPGVSRLRERVWGRLVERDRDLSALRRATRAAILIPILFAIADKGIGNPDVAIFAVFGSFSLLVLVDFGGPIRERVQAQALLALTGGVLVCAGTLASRSPLLAAGAMAVVAFCVLFAGVVSSVLAGASTSLLLSFILPVSLSGSASAIPDRLAGWGMASVASLFAIALLWPSPPRDLLRGPATAACQALATRLRSDSLYLLGAAGAPSADDHERVIAEADAAVGALQRGFLATPYRPTGLGTSARALVRLVDELNWLNVVVHSRDGARAGTVGNTTCAVQAAAAATLAAGADLLAMPGESPETLHAAQNELGAALSAMEQSANLDLPVDRAPGNGTAPGADQRSAEIITSLDPTFRAQELSFAVSEIARNIDLTVAAERRSWWQRLLGHQPEGLTSTLAAARERAATHVDPHSVWLHNSVRGAVALALAVFVAQTTGVQHSFWVTFGTLSVLRSNALNTGQFIARGVLGTVLGFIAGALVVSAIGTTTALLWVLLPLVVLFAGIAPAVISFTAGQAAFTLVLLILFNLLQPAGWRIGLVRIEDVLLGCAVSLVVGVLFWPRGAGAALRKALADAYGESAHYLQEAVAFAMLCCDFSSPAPSAPGDEGVRAAAASRRLDDAFRTYLTERGPKPVPLAEITTLITGAAALRLAGDAVLDLWERGEHRAQGDRAAARAELLAGGARVSDWYDELAGCLADARTVPDPLAQDDASAVRFVAAVRHDLLDRDGHATATAVRMIWTGDHLDAARRMQALLIEPARATTDAEGLSPLARIRAWRRTARVS